MTDAAPSADPRGLERVSARAWPAAHTEMLGGWALNASSGHSGRINACWPLSDPGMSPDRAIARAEAWYAARGLPPLFKIVETARAPTDLSRRLAARGYRPRTETIMMVGQTCPGSEPSVILDAEVGAAFAIVFAATANDPEDTRERLETLDRVPRPRAIARCEIDGVTAAIGACAVEGEWAGIFAMRTDPNFRRRGLARRILNALLNRAYAMNARWAWLQVEAENAPAIPLYAAAGFREAYRYRYWDRAGG